MLDAFNFMSQEFNEPTQKKLALHFLEINHYILQYFTPKQIVDPLAQEKEAVAQLHDAEKSR